MFGNSCYEFAETKSVESGQRTGYFLRLKLVITTLAPLASLTHARYLAALVS